MAMRTAVVTGGSAGIGLATADRLARDVLRAIDRNRAILVKPAVAHAQWLFARLAPTLMNRMAMRFVTAQRSRQAAVRSTAP